jgi:hypothetical protein
MKSSLTYRHVFIIFLVLSIIGLFILMLPSVKKNLLKVCNEIDKRTTITIGPSR